jgi:hypothetical protein
MIYETRMGVHHPRPRARAISGVSDFVWTLEFKDGPPIRLPGVSGRARGLRNDDDGPESYLDAGTP